MFYGAEPGHLWNRALSVWALCRKVLFFLLCWSFPTTNTSPGVFHLYLSSVTQWDPPKKPVESANKSKQFCQDGQDGDASHVDSGPDSVSYAPAPKTAEEFTKILEAISNCQTDLTTKTDKVTFYVSLLVNTEAGCLGLILTWVTLRTPSDPQQTKLTKLSAS